MADGYFERGEIYWCRIDHNVGVEMGLTRPAVVVSKTENNNKLDCVEIAWLTSKPKTGMNFVNTMATGRESWIIAQQIYTVDKSRFGKFMGKLTYHEQRELDAALEDGFDLGYDDTGALAAKDREIAERDEVIERLTRQIEDLTAEAKKNADLQAKKDASMIVECEKAMRLYHASLDQLVSFTLDRDLSARVAAAKTVWETAPVVTEEPPVVEIEETETVQPTEDTEDTEDKVDINHCTITRLKKLGFTLAMARQIVKYRPFVSVDDMKKRVPGLKATRFRIVEPKLCCTPITEITQAPAKASIFVKAEPDPGYEVEEQEQPTEQEQPVVSEVEEKPVRELEVVNVNRASGREIMQALACGKDQAYSISAYRNKNGKFVSVDEILKCPRITKRWLERYRDRLEV